MTMQLITASLLAAAGTISVFVAVRFERRMQQYRRPGVSYRDVTLRRDGGWKRDDLFDETGLRYQRRASAWGFTGAALWVAGLLAWVVLGLLAP